MFTGIIEEVGHVVSLVRSAKGGRLTVKACTVLEGTKIGDSIAVNGVCLTVTEQTSNRFTADIMAETLRCSALGNLRPGSYVNMERAMRADDRFGGHIVSGHIDGMGKLQSVKQEDNATWLTIAAPAKLSRYIVEKGSIAIDGVSLTVARGGTTEFQVSIIPHTGGQTILLQKRPGDYVNLECDIIGKYIEKLIAPQSKGLTVEYLMENGF